MGFTDYIKEKFKKDEGFAEAEREMRIKQKLVERQKSANERELERYLKEKREERIKQELDGFRKRQQKELWEGNMLNQKNIFTGHKNILEEKKLFSVKNTIHKSKGMFFK